MDRRSHPLAPTTSPMNSHIRLIVALIGFVVCFDMAFAQTKRARHFDIRDDAAETSQATVAGLRASSAKKGAKAAAGLHATMAAGKAKLSAAVPGLQVEVNPVTKAPE